MKKTRPYPLSILLGIVAAIAATNSSSAPPDGDELPHYAFISGELTTSFKNSVQTIAGSDGKKLLLEDTTLRLPFGKNVSFRFTPAVALSNEFAEVSEVSVAFNSIAASKREANVAADNQAIQDGANLEVGRLESQASAAIALGNEDAAIELQQKAQEIAFETSELISQTQAMIDEGWFEKEDVFDLYFATFSIKPHQDIKDAFAALVMTYDETDPLLKRQEIKKSIVSMASLGDLMADTETPIKVSKSFVEQTVIGAEIEVFIFSGEGKPIATNRSSALKQLTPEQLKRWRELEAQNTSLAL